MPCEAKHHMQSILYTFGNQETLSFIVLDTVHIIFLAGLDLPTKARGSASRRRRAEVRTPSARAKRKVLRRL